MRILEIITVPFFTPRGTAFSALHRTQALSHLGHEVSVLAYPLGADVDLPGVKIHRTPRVPGIRSIPMGFSFRKLVLDLLLALETARWLALRGPWDLVHVHEEGAIWLALLRPFHRARVLYDMHSDLVEQLSNFGTRGSSLLRGVTRFFVRLAVRRADAVIVICPELLDLVRSLRPEVPVALIENLPVTWDLPVATDAEVARLRDELSLGGCRIALYTGTMGSNQGLELAVEAMAKLGERLVDLRLVLVGGSEEEQERLRSLARRLGAEGAVVFAGARPPGEMPAFMQMADVLVSPRVAGTNTPLKIYSYLAAGKPIVATDLYSHRQALDEATALLVEPRAAALAAGLRTVLEDPALARRLAEAARAEARSRFAIDGYRDCVAHIFAQAVARPTSAP